MNYKLSEKILEQIKKAEKILVNCHRSPDPDSVGSALALKGVLTKMGKEVKMICPTGVPQDCKFLSGSEAIEKVSFDKFDFAKFDLFILLDSGSSQMVTGLRDPMKFPIPTAVIDHHKTNLMYADINLVDDKTSSTAEVLYLVFEDWGVKPDREIAQALLTGILADTGVFEYPGVTANTLGVAQKLIEIGADKDEIILNVFKTISFAKLKFWGEIIRRMELDEKYGFVFSALPYDIYSEFEKPVSAKETGASLFATVVDGTKFGMIMVEEDKGVLSISLRARGKAFDVSKIAEKFGGGGHRAAAGAKVYDMEFEKAKEAVLQGAREVVDEVGKG